MHKAWNKWLERSPQHIRTARWVKLVIHSNPCHLTINTFSSLCLGSYCYWACLLLEACHLWLKYLISTNCLWSLAQDCRGVVLLQINSIRNKIRKFIVSVLHHLTDHCTCRVISPSQAFSAWEEMLSQLPIQINLAACNHTRIPCMQMSEWHLDVRSSLKVTKLWSSE